MGAIWRANWRTSCDDIIYGKHMLSKTICVCGDGSGRGGRRRRMAVCGVGVRRAACDSGVSTAAVVETAAAEAGRL